MLTLYDQYLSQAIEAGAKGYLLKDIKREELTQAIRQVYRGQVVTSEHIKSKTQFDYEDRYSKRIGEILQGKPYSTEDKRSLQEVLSEVATGIENTRLYQGIQSQRAELKKVQRGILHAMSLLMETRDPYTNSHQQQVAELASKIAAEMGLSQWDIEGIRITGLLHDVGKITVPVELLCRPGNINQYEFSIIKTHAQVGYEILKEIEFPWPISQVILQHHERLNGSGYPSGLSGKDITIEARILGVADVIEAMSSHRPYRPALGFDCILEEISRERGILYDPEVVDAFLRLVAEHGMEKLLERKQE
ncbi:MAG: HD domain-containing protein [Chloroflexi bacterium]|nr:HD domain-containing protein [Chloroflexota bacterium]